VGIVTIAFYFALIANKRQSRVYRVGWEARNV